MENSAYTRTLATDVKDAEGNVVDTSEFFGTREDASDEDAAEEATDSVDESREDTDA